MQLTKIFKINKIAILEKRDSLRQGNCFNDLLLMKLPKRKPVYPPKPPQII